MAVKGCYQHKRRKKRKRAKQKYYVWKIQYWNKWDNRRGGRLSCCLNCTLPSPYPHGGSVLPPLTFGPTCNCFGQCDFLGGGLKHVCVVEFILLPFCYQREKSMSWVGHWPQEENGMHIFLSAQHSIVNYRNYVVQQISRTCLPV